MANKSVIGLATIRFSDTTFLYGVGLEWNDIKAM
jgi:hypothetical protein